MEYQTERFNLPFEDQQVAVRLQRPIQEQAAAARLLLLSFASDSAHSLTVAPYRLVADCFLAAGHLALSFDLPNHGTQVNSYGEGITGMRNAQVAGANPFDAFVRQGMAVIDSCLDQGLARPGYIAVCGTSRGGYMALRLLAADARIAAGAGFAPVTDWRYLHEFDSDRERQDVMALKLSSYAARLAQKNLFLVIGNDDQRVSTESCRRLYVDVEQRKQTNDLSSEFHITADQGHSCSPKWYAKGADFLLHKRCY